MEPFAFEVGSALRADLVASGRVERPRSTAADQGWSALLFAAGRTADAMSSRPYPRQTHELKRETGNWEGCCGHEIILGSQVSTTGYQVQVFRFGCRSRACFPHPHLRPFLNP